MVDKPQSNEMKQGTAETGAPASGRMSGGGGAGGAGAGGVLVPSHRTADVRDAVAEMAERAQIISQEAGSKITAAMRDVIGAAAGLAGFAVESARDLVQYMVRRGQMSQDEADRLIRQAEDAQGGGRRASGDRPRPSVGKATADRGAPRESSSREVTARVDHASAASTTGSTKSAPAAAKGASAKKQAPASAAARPAKKAGGKSAAAEKKPAKKSPTKKRR